MVRGDGQEGRMRDAGRPAQAGQRARGRVEPESLDVLSPEPTKTSSWPASAAAAQKASRTVIQIRAARFFIFCYLTERTV